MFPRSDLSGCSPLPIACLEVVISFTVRSRLMGKQGETHTSLVNAVDKQGKTHDPIILPLC